MAAEYPAAIPTMISPGTTLATPTHESIHTKENEEIVAIATALGTGLSNVLGKTSITGLIKGNGTVMAAATTADYIQTALGTAEGQMIVYTASGAVSALSAPGTTGYVLTADTTIGGKMTWKAASGGATVSRGTFGSASLDTAGGYAITHNLGLSAPYAVVLTIFGDGTIGQMIPDSIVGSTNAVVVGMASFTAGTMGTCGYALVAG